MDGASPRLRRRRGVATCALSLPGSRRASVSCEKFRSKAPLDRDHLTGGDNGFTLLGAHGAPTDRARTPAGAAAARAHRLETSGRGTGQIWSATTGRGL